MGTPSIWSVAFLVLVVAVAAFVSYYTQRLLQIHQWKRIAVARGVTEHIQVGFLQSPYKVYEHYLKSHADSEARQKERQKGHAEWQEERKRKRELQAKLNAQEKANKDFLLQALEERGVVYEGKHLWDYQGFRARRHTDISTDPEFVDSIAQILKMGGHIKMGMSSRHVIEIWGSPTEKIVAQEKTYLTYGGTPPAALNSWMTN